MKCLFVLYDSECDMCWACRDWLSKQPAFVELRFLPLQSPEVRRRFPGIEKHGLGEELVVVSDEGAVYRGSSAWIMCLYALMEYREWSQRLANPALLPLARQICMLVSKHRLQLSKWLFRGTADKIRKRLGDAPLPACARPPVAVAVPRDPSRRRPYHYE